MSGLFLSVPPQFLNWIEIRRIRRQLVGKEATGGFQRLFEGVHIFTMMIGRTIFNQDDGTGIPDDLDFRSTESLGLDLVTILAEDQLGGRIELDRTKGTMFRIQF